MAQFLDSCPYVPLGEYNWKGLVGLGDSSKGASRCHGIAIDWNPTVICLFMSLFAVTIWICLEVTIQALTTFRRWSTVYFWSIILTAWAVILYAICVTLIFFSEQGKMVVVTVLYPIAWILTNTGAITVLYSRLHLIIDSPRALKWLAWILMGVGIPFQVFLVVAATGNSKKLFYLGMAVHNVAYRLETIISFVEIALSTAYIYFFVMRFMKDRNSGSRSAKKRNQLRWTFIILILGELFVIAGDVAIITVWLDGIFLARLAIAPFVYGTKLKVEFLILNCLTSMTKQTAELRHITISTGDHTNVATLTAAVMAAENVLEIDATINIDHAESSVAALKRTNSEDMMHTDISRRMAAAASYDA